LDREFPYDMISSTSPEKDTGPYFPFATSADTEASSAFGNILKSVKLYRAVKDFGAMT